MSVSDVSIANRALTLLSAGRILSLSEDSENARKISAIYEDTRNALLEEHNWNFARTEVTLSLLSLFPVLETWANAFQLPSDCIRVIRMQQDIAFAIYSDRLYTNSDTASIEYIIRVTDPTKFSSGFVKALASKIASDLSFGITQNATLAANMYKIAERDLSEAKWSDAQAGLGIQQTAGTFITAREQ